MSEYFPKKVAALAVVLGLGLTACTSEGGTTSEAKPGSSASKPANFTPQLKVRYLSNGMRELRVSDLKGPGINDGDYNFFQDVLQWCENGDLVEETNGYDDRSGTVASSVDRRSNFLACADGRLTPSDFKGNPSETN